MADFTIRPVWQIDHDALATLSKAWCGSRIGKDEVVKTATLIGRVGRVLHGASKEMILGFAVGRVEAGEVVLRWLAADPYSRVTVLRALVGSLRREFPGVDIVVRVANDRSLLEFLEDLKDASGEKVVPDSSRGKFSDERASHVYVRLRAHQADPGGGSVDSEKTVVRHARYRR